MKVEGRGNRWFGVRCGGIGGSNRKVGQVGLGFADSFGIVGRGSGRNRVGGMGLVGRVRGVVNGVSGFGTGGTIGT